MLSRIRGPADRRTADRGVEGARTTRAGRWQSARRARRAPSRNRHARRASVSDRGARPRRRFRGRRHECGVQTRLRSSGLLAQRRLRALGSWCNGPSRPRWLGRRYANPKSTCQLRKCAAVLDSATPHSSIAERFATARTHLLRTLTLRQSNFGRSVGRRQRCPCSTVPSRPGAREDTNRFGTGRHCCRGTGRGLHRRVAARLQKPRDQSESAARFVSSARRCRAQDRAPTNS